MYQRIVIYTADIIVITGKSNSYAKKLMAKIRKDLGKKRTDLIDVEEFAKEVGLNTELIIRTINPKSQKNT
jgi:ribosomal protein S3